MKRLFIVGIGPGNKENMSMEAMDAMESSHILVGYTKYIQLVKSLFPEKEVFTNGMKQEVDRCRKAMELANEGKTVAMICSGDAGVYGMAGPLCQLSPEYPEVEIVVVPGITAALSGAAVLGAPLTHDFAVISLSDLMTPWEKIEQRLACASQADFCIAIYNPSSRKRADYLQKACQIMMKYKSPETICGTVQNIGRQGQTSEIMTLDELQYRDTDMFTTVFIGNSSTEIINGRMVTPRGYKID